jgi:hypothetical protein
MMDTWRGAVRRLIAAVCMIVLAATAAAPVNAVRLQRAPLLELLPPAPEGGSWFSVTGQGTRSLDEHAATFTDPDEATPLLVDWGWRENGFRLIEDSRALGDGTPAPYLYMSLTRFDNSDGASAAMPYIVQDLIAGEGHQELPVGSPVGDEARGLVVPVDGGTDFTLYVRSDSLIMRISVLLNDDNPIADPVQIAESIIAREASPPAPTVVVPSMLPALLETLPPDLPSCLRLHGEEVFDFPAVVARFPMMPDAGERLAALGWEAGAYRQFTCDVPPSDSLNWVDMSVHQFRDAASAAEAVPYFAHARTVGTQLAEVTPMQLGDESAAIAGPSELGTEITLYVSRGPLLLRATGVALNEDPRPDTELVMTALVLSAMDHQRNLLTGETPTVSAAQAPAMTQSETDERRTPDGSGTGTDESAQAQANATCTTTIGADGSIIQPQGCAIESSSPPPLGQLDPGAPAIDSPTDPNQCAPSYPGVCIPPPPPDLSCDDVGYSDFAVLAPDPHGFDGDHDSRGCEPYVEDLVPVEEPEPKWDEPDYRDYPEDHYDENEYVDPCDRMRCVGP